jgi:hypothetical protein
LGLKSSEGRQVNGFMDGLCYLSSCLNGFFQGFQLGMVRGGGISQVNLKSILELVERLENPLTMGFSIATGELLAKFSPLRDGRSIEIHDVVRDLSEFSRSQFFF